MTCHSCIFANNHPTKKPTKVLNGGKTFCNNPESPKHLKVVPKTDGCGKFKEKEK